MDSLGKMYNNKMNDSIKAKVRKQALKFKNEIRKSRRNVMPDTSGTSQYQQ